MTRPRSQPDRISVWRVIKHLESCVASDKDKCFVEDNNDQ